jgi:subtilisin family serine protease
LNGGFSATLPEQAIKALQKKFGAAEGAGRGQHTIIIEPDYIATKNQLNTNLWGLDRIDALTLDGKYSNFASPTAGQGVHVYVIDTGIAKEYDGNQLIIGGGRNFIADSGTVNPDNWTDCEGPGTHVA